MHTLHLDVPTFTNGGGLLLTLLLLAILGLAAASLHARPRCCRCQKRIPRRELTLRGAFTRETMCVTCYLGTFR